MAQLPKYDSPPVIETVLSAQFSPLPGLTTAHAGWFWKKYLSEEWTLVREAPVIQDVFERFEEERVWLEPSWKVSGEAEANRLQIIRRDNQRMVQVQPSRFAYNWKKSGEGDYPSYEQLLPEFTDHFRAFNAFVLEAGYPGLEINQWEVTYVNHIAKGELWKSTADWARLIPRLGTFNPTLEGQKFDAFNGTWSSTLGGNKGRLHIAVRHVRVGSTKGPETLAIQLVARGPVDEAKGLTLQAGFDLGHETIVSSFTELTSSEAHEYWGRSA